MDRLRKHIEAIVPLSNEEFEQVAPFFTLKKVKKHQYLIQEGEQANFEYLILSGIFRVFYLDSEGKEYIVQFAVENWWMADYQAYFNGNKATLHITCMAMPKYCASRWMAGKNFRPRCTKWSTFSG